MTIKTAFNLSLDNFDQQLTDDSASSELIYFPNRFVFIFRPLAGNYIKFIERKKSFVIYFLTGCSKDGWDETTLTFIKQVSPCKTELYKASP